MSIEVQYDGLNQLGTMAATQSESLDTAHSFVGGSCGSGPFSSGLLAVFGGQYAEAHDVMADATREGSWAAARSAAAIRASIRRYHDIDVQASSSMKGFEHEMEGSEPYREPPGGRGVANIPGAASNTASDASTVLDHAYKPPADPSQSVPLPGPKGIGGPGTPGDVTGLISNTTGMVNEAATTGEASEDSADYTDFENKHRGDED